MQEIKAICSGQLYLRITVTGRAPDTREPGDTAFAHLAVSALDKVVMRFRREGAEVEVIGLNEASATMVDKFAVHDKEGAADMITGH